MMPANYPNWADFVPGVSYRHNISVVLVAAAVGAVSAASVVVDLASVFPTAPQAGPIAAHAIVTAVPAMQPSAAVQDRSSIERTPTPSEHRPAHTSEPMPQPTLAPKPQPAPDGTEADRAATGSDAERQIAAPDAQIGEGEQREPNDVGVARHRFHGRLTRFPTPNHW